MLTALFVHGTAALAVVLAVVLVVGPPLALACSQASESLPARVMPLTRRVRGLWGGRRPCMRSARSVREQPRR
ncbi:hypothetical protein ACFVJH_26860 [Streptomyces decoyicus]|uniref:hypothetical protein n=1 Tax=Streptomyces decoyicus TaxID=249567 RepID=UPI003642612F